MVRPQVPFTPYPPAVARSVITLYTNRRAKGLVVNPIPGFPVTYPYGVPNDNYAAGRHTGEDHSTHQRIGYRVVAVSPSTVIQAATRGGTWGSAYGTVVILQTLIRGTTFQVGYCHLQRIAPGIQPGTRVLPGQLLGWSGNTGNSSGPHLHFEVRTAPFRYGSDTSPIRVKKG